MTLKSGYPMLVRIRTRYDDDNKGKWINDEFFFSKKRLHIKLLIGANLG